jgi:hypothetical protein
MTVQNSVNVRNARLNAWQYGSNNAQAANTPKAWATSTAVTQWTSWVQNGGNIYLCVASGTTSSSPGGPTGTGTSPITDGSASWLYIGTQGIGGAGALLTIYTGAQPASCSASETGTALVTFTLGANWVALASSGSTSVNSLPITATASYSGSSPQNAGHYRLFDVTGATCMEQGSVTATGGGGDATIDNISIANSQTVTLTAFSVTEPGA